MRLDQWARRRAPGPKAGNTVSDLLDAVPHAEIAQRRGLRETQVEGVASFYDQLDRRHIRVCTGSSCHFGGGPQLRARLEGLAGEVRCLGMCHEAPAARVGDRVYGRADRLPDRLWEPSAESPQDPVWGRSAPVRRESLVQPPVLLRRILNGPCSEIQDHYTLPPAQDILDILSQTGLRGRGGALYPTAAKWKAARDAPGAQRFVVANGDEGDPGSFVDRVLMEDDPHAVLAGMLACGLAIGATQGFLYVRAEYPQAQDVLREAIAEARRAGHLGEHFDVELVSGAGSYVCGEETALLRSLEGQRGEPSPKPPYPAEQGLWGKPTVVQNVETLALVPQLLRGVPGGVGRKLVCLSGAIARPGVVEVALGIPFREMLERGGGGALPDRPWKMALVGGPMGRVIDAADFDLPFSFEAMPGLGHGGVVLLDHSVSARDLALHLFDFARAESCGSCTPCRVGTQLMAAQPDIPSLDRVLRTMEMGSKCGFGQGAPRPVRDLIALYPQELFL